MRAYRELRWPQEKQKRYLEESSVLEEPGIELVIIIVVTIPIQKNKYQDNQNQNHREHRHQHHHGVVDLVLSPRLSPSQT